MKKKGVVIALALIIVISCSISASATVLSQAEADATQCPVDYSNLTAEQQALIQRNMEKGFTENEIAAMTEEELEYYQLLPINSDTTSTLDTLQNNLRSSCAYYSVPTTNIQQSTYYYCGPAATLQALYTAGVAGSVSGSTYAAKQQTLASTSYLFTDRDGATWIEYVPDTMDYFTNRTRHWATVTITDDHSGKSTLSYCCQSNLYYGNALVYLLETSDLGYYGGHSSAHYVTGTRIFSSDGTFYDYDNMSLSVADPNNNNNYYGNHTANFTAFVEAMNDYSTSVGPANLVW